MGTGGASETFGLLEHVPIPTYIYEAVTDEFILRFVNAAARAQNPNIVTFLGKPMGGLYRDQPELIADARRALEQRAPVVRELVLRRHDRTEATASLRVSFVPTSPSYLMVATESTGGTSSVEAALRESEARYRGLFASLPDGVILRGADGRILAGNDVAARLVGMSEAALLAGRDRLLDERVRLRDEAGRPIGEDELPSKTCIRTGHPVGPVIHELILEGVSRWLRVASEPIFASTGAVTASVTVFTDITDRVTAERALQAAVSRLDLALAAGRMGVWEYDATADSGWWSANMREIFGLTKDRPQTFPGFVTFVHPDDRPKVLAMARTFATLTDGRAFDLEFRIVGDDDLVRWARIQGRLVQTRLVGTIIDITEQRAMEDELRRAHRLESIGRLAGGIAHDFNNLLAAMMGALDLIEIECPPHMRDDVDTIRHGVVRARDLIKQLLAFARKQPIEFSEIDLGEMVSRVERLLRRLVGPSIEIVLEMAGRVVVRADASSLEQVLVNLVVNARDAMPTGGRLEVRVGTAGDRAELVVTDSGCGMDEETRRQVFDPFFTTKTTGTGLGLASSYGIVRQHGGDITIESAPGHGTTFRVFLPLVPGDRPPEVRAAAPAPAGAATGCVLVVDDEDLVRTITARLMRSLGYQVLEAPSADVALEIARTHPTAIDLMLCDVAMPLKDGPTLASEVLPLRPDLRVIFVSGYADNTVIQGIERAGFLAKPYTRAELLAKLEESRLGR